MATFGTAAAALVLVLSACGADSNHEGGQSSATTAGANANASATTAAPNVSGDITVFAAASLQGAFDKLGTEFQHSHPGTHVRFNYAGSSTLATQITGGAPADVFASANKSNMTTVEDANLVQGQPKLFAQNTLEIMVAHGNPKHIENLSDLANPDVKVAVCAPDVPCGAYSKEVFEKANVTVNPVSQETSVTGVVTRVSLGEADAGIVYTTDVKAGGNTVAGVAIPADNNVIADYPIAELTSAPNKTGANAFVNFVGGEEGQRVLADLGFKPAPAPQGVKSSGK